MADPEILALAKESTVHLEPTEDARLFPLLTLDDLDALPDIDWLIENMLPSLGLGMLYGVPGSGKTFCIIDLCLSAARGPFLFAKEFPVLKPCRVVYAAGEKFQGIKHRFRAACRRHGLSEEQRRRVRVCKGVPQLFDKDLDTNVGRFIKELQRDFPDGFDILIIDTLHSASVGAEENSSTDAGKEIHAVRAIQRAFHCAVIVVHHSNKGGLTERGSTAWRAAADLVLKVDKEADRLEGAINCRLSCEKMGDASDSFEILFKCSHEDGTESLAVEWGGRSTIAPRECRDEIKRVLVEQSGQWLEIKDIREASTMEAQGGRFPTREAFNHAANKLASQSEVTGIERSVRDGSKAKSSRNPFVYRYSAELIARARKVPDE